MIEENNQAAPLLEDTVPSAQHSIPTTFANEPMPTDENIPSPADSPGLNPALNRKRRKGPSPFLEGTTEPQARRAHPPEPITRLPDPPIYRAELEEAAQEIQARLLDQLSITNDCIIDLEEGTRKHFEGLDTQLNEAVSKMQVQETSTADTITNLTDQV